MTNPLVAPTPAIPQPAGIGAPLAEISIPNGYAKSWLIAHNPRLADKATREGFRKWGEHLMIRLGAMQDAMQLNMTGNRLKRLSSYLQKPDEVWQEQQQKLPNQWKKAHDDFQELRAAAARGEFNDQPSG